MSQTLQLKELHEERTTLMLQARKIIEDSKRERRELSTDEQDKFDLMHSEADRLKKLMDNAKRQLDLEQKDAESFAEQRHAERQQAKSALEPELRKAIQSRAFTNWLRRGDAGLTHEERNALIADPELRAQQVTTDNSGTATAQFVPEDFQRELEVAMTSYVGVMRSRARVIRTSTGADLPWPHYNDTGNAGQLIAEGDTITEQTITTSSTTLGAFMYTSDSILVSYQLLQDSAFNMDNEVRRALGERLGRILNTHTTTGTGTGQPKGVVTAATDSGVTFAAPAATTVVTYPNMLDVFHSVDPDYRNNAEWMFHDDMLAKLRQVVDGNGAFLWQPAMQPGAPDTILGKTFVINQGMATPDSTGNKALLFGDFSKYIVRLVTPSTVMRLNERYADKLQVGFIGFMRMDGDLINAGTNPIVWADCNAA